MSENVYSNIIAQNDILTDKELHETRFIKSGSGQVEYICKAVQPNADTASPVWMITKLHYDGSGFCYRIQLPDLGSGYRYIVDNAPSYFS